MSIVLHEPVPRVHDEFSYLLMADTFSSGHITNTAPPFPEFFDTFHVLLTPTRVSKYFPAQGAFLSLGQKLTAHAIFGVWLSSALACAATVWMLEAWVGLPWALLGGCLMTLQYGIFSYWSQTYWGGMAAALGGALFFGAIRRLWDSFCWQNAIWFALGLIILANSRPLEGLLSVVPVTALFLFSIWKKQRWTELGFFSRLLVPAASLLACGAVAMGLYNRAITGSAFKTPYALHEEQYQESPPLIFMPQRPPLTYSSLQLRRYYEGWELNVYKNQRHLRYWLDADGRKIASWWQFYCGFLLSVPLFIPPLLRPGKIRILQLLFLAGLLALWLIPDSYPNGWRIPVDFLALLEVWILWRTFDDTWSRLAMATCTLVMTLLLFAKWEFPHYFAPAACLVLYVQVVGLKRMWEWNPSEAKIAVEKLSRSERRRREREKNDSTSILAPWLRRIVYLLPVACAVALVLRVEGRINGWEEDPHGVVRFALLTDDWSLDRANIYQWLEQQTKPQLVFVRYSPRHNVNFEWVYNHPDIMHSHVIWARDLGTEHNKLLLNLVPERTVWLIEADRRHPQLVPYEEANPQPVMPVAPANPPSASEQNE